MKHNVLARFFNHTLLGVSLGLGLLGLGLNAGAQKVPVEGADYRILRPAQPTESQGKIEVIEFFWYGCPHCNALEPALNEWIKRQGPDVVVKHVPAAFNALYVLHQRLYYTLDALGKEPELRAKVFNTIHVEQNILNTPDLMADWAAKNGIDRKKFLDTYNSFTVQAKVQRATQMASAYAIDGVPSISVNGKVVLGVTATTLGNIDYFVNAERALLKPVTAQPAPATKKS